MNAIQGWLTHWKGAATQRALWIGTMLVLLGTKLGAAAAEKAIPADAFAKLDLQAAGLEDVVAAFGEPMKYVWGNDEFDRGQLPERYVAVFPAGLGVFMLSGHVEEVRHEGDDGYLFAGKIQVGSTLDDALALLGTPRKIVTGKALGWEDQVLYKDIEGRDGDDYYANSDQRVRLFFRGDRVAGIYITRPQGSAADQSAAPAMTKVDSVNEFDDVRWKDLSALDLSAKKGLTATLGFNLQTKWPKGLPAGESPRRILAAARNPGLGVHALHQSGVTGKGVNVAIIDQPLYENHPEFARKIVKYFDAGCESDNSMHGPAVASLLVGTKCGTAPGARLYYAAAPSWLADSAYYAKSLDWIVDQNASLPLTQKIRVVSVSAAPSGPGSPFTKNQVMWDDACHRARDAGILVLDCTMTSGFIGPCWYDPTLPEDVARCKAGFPGMGQFRASGHILAPCSNRTTAEHLDQSEPSYAYWGRGGLSWSIPYAAGVLAMGWQLAPDLTADEMKQLLFDSSYVDPNGAKYINPPKFIELVKQKLKP